LIGILLFLTYIIIFSNLGNFYRCLWLIPKDLGPQRLNYIFKLPRLRWVFFGSGVMAAATLIIILAIILASDHIIISLILAQYLFAIITDNQPQNSLPFMSIIVASLLSEAKGRWRAVSSISALILAIFGVISAYNRDVQDLFTRPGNYRPLKIKGLEDLRWQDPTRIWAGEVWGRDLEELSAYINGKKFFIFPDFTILYGTLASPPPQPFLFFDRGLSYPDRYSRSTDLELLSGLYDSRIEYIVIERYSYLGTLRRLQDFPETVDFIRKNFTMIKRIGIFEVYRIRSR